jgi:chaperonin GroES
MKKTQKPASKTKVQPLGDRVLVRPIEEKKEEKTKSGIYLPTTAQKEGGFMRGEVVAVGDGWYQDAELIPLRVHVGDEIMFSKYGYEEITVDDKEFFIIKEDNILAIINQ